MRYPNGSGRLVAGFVALAVAVGCGGGNGGGGQPAADPNTFYVDAQSGSDGGTGSASSPWATITFALAQVSAGATVRLLPGLYVEQFGIAIPAGVDLIGDEATKGKGTAETRIRGGSGIASALPSHAVEMGAGAVLAGVVVENDRPGAAPGGIGAFPLESGVTIRNCTFEGSAGPGVSIDAGTQNHVVVDNDFANNGVGLNFVGGIGTRVERNVFRNNMVGVVYMGTAGGDLGGGAAGSTGGNVLSCNTAADLGTENAAGVTIYANDNFWDHVAPSGNDIVDFGGGTPTILTTGAQLAPSNCP